MKHFFFVWFHRKTKRKYLYTNIVAPNPNSYINNGITLTSSISKLFSQVLPLRHKMYIVNINTSYRNQENSDAVIIKLPYLSMLSCVVQLCNQKLEGKNQLAVFHLNLSTIDWCTPVSESLHANCSQICAQKEGKNQLAVFQWNLSTLDWRTPYSDLVYTTGRQICS